MEIQVPIQPCLSLPWDEEREQGEMSSWKVSDISLAAQHKIIGERSKKMPKIIDEF